MYHKKLQQHNTLFKDVDDIKQFLMDNDVKLTVTFEIEYRDLIDVIYYGFKDCEYKSLNADDYIRFIERTTTCKDKPFNIVCKFYKVDNDVHGYVTKYFIEGKYPYTSGFHVKPENIKYFNGLNRLNVIIV